MMATMEPMKDETSAVDVSMRFLQALGRRDFAEIETLLASNVWVRVLLTRKIHETSTAEGAIAAFREWFGEPTDFKVVETAHESMATREFLRYRFLLRPVWAPDQWHVIEQVGYCRVREGLISRIDLVCTGYHPVDESGEPLEKD